MAGKGHHVQIHRASSSRTPWLTCICTNKIDMVILSSSIRGAWARCGTSPSPTSGWRTWPPPSPSTSSTVTGAARGAPTGPARWPSPAWRTGASSGRTRSSRCAWRAATPGRAPGSAWWTCACRRRRARRPAPWRRSAGTPTARRRGR
jgi:hypothetical protein